MNQTQPKQYGDCLRANGSSKLNAEKQKAFTCGGSDERKEGGSDNRQILAQEVFNSIDMEAEQAEFPTTPRSHTHPNNTTLGDMDTSANRTAKN